MESLPCTTRGTSIEVHPLPTLIILHGFQWNKCTGTRVHSVRTRVPYRTYYSSCYCSRCKAIPTYSTRVPTGTLVVMAIPLPTRVYPIHTRDTRLDCTYTSTHVYTCPCPWVCIVYTVYSSIAIHVPGKNIYSVLWYSIGNITCNMACYIQYV